MAKDVKVAIIGDAKKLADALDDADKKVGAFGGSVGKLAGVIGGAFAVGAVVDFGQSAFGAFEEADKIAKQTEAVIKSTGAAAGLTADEFGDLSEAISKKTGVDDELIQTSENVLATFTHIKDGVGEADDVFSDATATIVDMSVALGSDMQGASIQVGKALNDPIKGITALTKVGVTFTDQQKAQIKAMQEAGDMAGAQRIILDELAKEFGGSAEAQATSMDKAKVAVGNLQEAIGGALAPAVEGFAGFVADPFVPVLLSVTDNLGFVGTAAKAVAGFFDEHKAAAIALGSVIGVLTAGLVAFKIATIATSIATNIAAVAQGVWTGVTAVASAAQWAFNVALSANPIALVVIAIAALAAGVVIAYQKVGWFHDAVNAVKDSLVWFWGNVLVPIGLWFKDDFAPAVAAVASKFADFGKKVGEIATGVAGFAKDVGSAFGTAYNAVSGFVSDVAGFVSDIISGTKSTLSTLASVITAPYRAAFNAIADAWNATIGKLSFKVPDWVPGLGGKGWDVPDIPRLALGGIVSKPTLALIGESGPEAVVPLGRGGGAGGAGVRGASSYNITVNVGPGGDLAEAGRQMVAAIKKYEGRNGPVFVAA